MKKTSTKRSKTTAQNLEKRFDAGQDVLDYFATEEAIFRVNVDFPLWMVRGLDRESSRMGVARQALVKMWIGDRLDQLKTSGAKPKRKQSSRRNAG